MTTNYQCFYCGHFKKTKKKRCKFKGGHEYYAIGREPNLAKKGGWYTKDGWVEGIIGE